MRRIILAFTLFLCACGSDRPLNFACPRFNEFRVAVPVTPGGPIRPAVAGSLDEVFADAATPAPGPGASGPRPVNMLVVSGGGKWGAYGAGLLDQWSDESDPVRPSFDVVTGVSTGALQSTLAFIGRDADADLVRAYTIDHEAQLVKRYGKLFFLTHGSTASLKPLVEYARGFAEPYFPKVAAEYRKGRRLMVGTVDALDGRMYAIDLTRIAAELDGKERSDCYIGALLASAAIPVVFRQVTINGTPYFDAGVRHSVFLAGVQGSAARGLASRGREGNLYVLMNGVTGAGIAKQVKPTLFGAVGRLRELVFDQIEQNSVYAVSQQTPQLSTWVASAAGHGCKEAESDEDIFNPDFMRCLIIAGQETWKAGSPWHPYPET
ncbi:MAG: patatin-like phospholipase family protein [Allosphingosinicella sp.]